MFLVDLRRIDAEVWDKESHLEWGLQWKKVRIITDSSVKTEAHFWKLLFWEKRGISAFVVAEAWCFTDKTAVGWTKLCQITHSSYVMSVTVHEGQQWGHLFYLGLKDVFKLYC